MSENQHELMIINENLDSLVQVMPEHKEMLAEVQKNLPEIHRATSLFGKTQSQFMDNMLTVSHPTTLRNIRQILAEMNRSASALKEAYFNNRKKEIELQKKLRSLNETQDELDKELLQVEIDEIKMQLESGQIYISGAIRKITNYNEQYQLLTKKVMEEQNVKQFNEVNFEAEEEKYHIMKAFEQALCAARSHHGIIDEGNQIYLQQIGINGATAQHFVSQFLNQETKHLMEGKAPTHKAVLNFLNDMAIYFKGCSQVYAEYKGMKTTTDLALLKEGDIRLLLKGEGA